jgi:alanine-synthesizing transaminase
VGHVGALTFVLNGLSKMSGLPQMKLAWIHVSGPGDLLSQAIDRLAFIADAYLSVGTPVQHAAPVLLGACRTVAPQIICRIETNFAALELLGKRSGGACRVLAREGGWYAVVRLPDECSDEEVALGLLGRDGVLAHPGYFYDFPPAGAFLVLSLLPALDVFKDGAERIVDRVSRWNPADRRAGRDAR